MNFIKHYAYLSTSFVSGLTQQWTWSLGNFINLIKLFPRVQCFLTSVRANYYKLLKSSKNRDNKNNKLIKTRKQSEGGICNKRYYQKCIKTCSKVSNKRLLIKVDYYVNPKNIVFTIDKYNTIS